MWALLRLNVRGHDGTLRAFPNVFRHRGTWLCAGSRSDLRDMQCGYHAAMTIGVDANWKTIADGFGGTDYTQTVHPELERYLDLPESDRITNGDAVDGAGDGDGAHQPELILETAARLSELDGVEAFTMRRLAEQLGVAVTSIYWHIGHHSCSFPFSRRWRRTWPNWAPPEPTSHCRSTSFPLQSPTDYDAIFEDGLDTLLAPLR